MDQDRKFMQRALELAVKGSGHTSPNPMVGAIIVKDGRVIGEGFHERYGEAHAEIMAINSASEPIVGATMYCTLEPCCHSISDKITPPCTKRLLEEKFSRIVIAMPDPNPHVSGKGIDILRDSGIRVDVGLLRHEAEQLNEAYCHYIQFQVPFVHLKMAMSLDGRIATSTQHSKWITDLSARRHVHQMRHEHAAVLVGRHTVETDDPKLTVREVTGKNPKRIILDSGLRLDESNNVFSDEHRDKTILFIGKHADPGKVARLRKRGVQIEVAPLTIGKISLSFLLERLGQMKLSSLLVEGGSEIHTSFLRENLFDKLSCFVAPLIIGKGIEAVGELGITDVSEALRLSNVNYQQINEQILLTAYRNKEVVWKIPSREATCLQEL
ncbi:MAG: bifunctional diaminohydroxyphosphoribosylaminopyrimidine deaminase/5-amino-6-(5-phosphoribosylamino)uracil reductase RibD [Calditrichia bacterium]